jgi:hypothetical protein
MNWAVNILAARIIAAVPVIIHRKLRKPGVLLTSGGNWKPGGGWPRETMVFEFVDMPPQPW